MRIAVYPGSFDPITLGHLDVIARASVLFDRLIVAVLVNPRKTPAIPGSERVAIIGEAVADAGIGLNDAVEVMTFDGLTVELARSVGAGHIVRGLRAVSDFEAELQMAQMNHRMAPDVDTVFFMTGIEHAYLSSSLVREIARFGGDVSGMVPPAVLRRTRPGTA
ncbi:MAG: pantetheine-phosphate adenylyltransferase [Chloroflexota bacterium]